MCRRGGALFGCSALMMMMMFRERTDRIALTLDALDQDRR
jgi:hypothetical protein